VIPERRREHHVVVRRGRALTYDVERTFVLDAPSGIAPLGAAASSAELDDWLRAEGVLTRAAPAPRVRGARVPSLTDVSLDIAGACNMACVYCFEAALGSRKGPMNRATRDAALAFAFAMAPGPLTLHFGSGEPLLDAGAFCATVEAAEARAREAGKALRLELTTNGTCITPDLAEFLRAHDVVVRVSCDGPPAVHDAFRPLAGGRPSYRDVERGLRLLLALFPERVVVNSVLSHPTRLVELWTWARSIGIHHLHVIKVGTRESAPAALRREDLAVYRSDLARIAEDIFADVASGRAAIDFQPFTKVIRRLVLPEPALRFCGAGATYVGVASDGGVYPCIRHLGVETYAFGSVTVGIDDRARAAFLTGPAADVDVRDGCRRCWARYLCGGGCYADSTIYRDGNTSPPLEYCGFWRAEIEEAIALYADLRRHDPAACLRVLGTEPDRLLDDLDDARGPCLHETTCG
jgi:uncharacterized protein